MTAQARTVYVHFQNAPSSEELELFINKVGFPVYITTGDSAPADPEYDILIAGRASVELLSASPKLTTLIIPWAGLPPVTRDRLKSFPHLAVHNIHHNAPAAAELALALLLSAFKRIIPADQALRNHDWSPRFIPLEPPLLAGQTALIMGMGAIGKRLSRALHALDMEICCVRRQPGRTAIPEYVKAEYGPADLPDILPQAQVLMLCLPLTVETEKIIGTRELGFLPPAAVLVNVGRAQLVEEAALYRALETGQLGAAGLDVWYRYPTSESDRTHLPVSDFPFHTLTNVVLSPHRGGAFGTRVIEEARMSELARSVRALAEGDEVPHKVDLAAGY